MAVVAVLGMNVYAINGGVENPAVTVGIPVERIQTVGVPKRGATAGTQVWVGKHKPSNYDSLYSEVAVSSDMSSDATYYYSVNTVAEILTAING